MTGVPLTWTDVLIALGAVLFAYPFVFYPIGVRLLARSLGKKNDWPASDMPPPIAMVICALNEEKIIRQKVENCLNLDYPSDRLRVIIVSDGSTDRTPDIVREYVRPGLELVERKERRGKVANLNDVVPVQPEEIIVLSDANVIYDQQALRHLVAPFADQAIGCVSGKVFLVETAEDLRSGESNYYSVEWQLQDGASRLYAMPGADGAMYAIRRDLFSLLPNDTLIEDFVVTIGVVRQGKRVVFQPKALAWEQGPSGIREEFHRKVRIAAGAAQGLLRGNAWPVHAPAAFWFIWISHKLLRWLSPLLALLVIFVAALSPDRPISLIVLWGAAALLTLSGVRLSTGIQKTIFNWPFYFVFGQVALLVGMVKGLTGKQSVLWAKANR